MVKACGLAVIIGAVLVAGCHASTDPAPPAATPITSAGASGRAPVQGMVPHPGPGVASADSHVGSKGGG
jgi:nitrous oxide reductase accessory protein NosL